MHYEATTLTQPTPWTIDQIGSFKLGLRAHHQVRTALTIAKQMRRDGDGEVEDAARAIRLMLGAALFDREMDEVYAWEEFEADDEEDYDEQVVAYMDGTQVLIDALSVDHNLPQAYGSEGVA
jgi:hypothetical protein